MIAINLISTEQKEKIRFKMIYLTIKKSFLIVILFMAVFSLLALWGEYYLKQYINQKDVAYWDTLNKNNELTAQVKIINAKIGALSAADKNAINIWPFLSQLKKLTPSGINYSHLKASAAGLELWGIALKRENLVGLKENLAQAGLFTSVNLLPEYLIAKENNNFYLSAAVDWLKISPL